MEPAALLKDGLEYAAIAFSTGVFLHCFLDDRIVITLKRLGVIFLSTIFLSFLHHLMKAQIGWSAILFLSFFVCPAIVLQWSIRTDLAGFIRRAFYIISTELCLGVYALELTILGAALARVKNVVQKAGMTDASEDTGMYLLYLTVILLIGVGLHFRIARRGNVMLFRKSDMALCVAMGVIVLLSMGLFLNIEANETIVLYRLTLESVLFLLLIVMPLMIYKNRQSAYFNEMSAHNESYLEAELAASRQYRETQEETRAFRHDMRNNLMLLAGLLKEKTYEEAERYLEDLSGELAELSPRIVTGDDMLDSLISSKLPELDRQGIILSVNGVIDGGLSWKPIDICAVFANAIDNAIRACEFLPEGVERYIRISFRKTELQRVITITNRTAEKVDCAKLLSGEGRYTTKQEKSLHGFGLRNIRRTVEKYGGIMQLSSDEDEFRMTIVLTQ